MAVMPIVIRQIVTIDNAIIQDGTWSSRLLKNISNSPRTKSGANTSQNLLHKTARSEIGALCIIQKALPSRLTAGKANRTATALKTNPASAKFAKETSVRSVPAGIGERSRGKTLKL